ncbi:MAG: DMT family transporter [Deltaproteobacteria bacterium]
MAIAALFVLLWSTGFIGTKLGLPYAEPFTFLLVRFWIVAALMLVIALATRASWPKSWHEAGHTAVAGLLIHGVFLSGVFSSMYNGIPAGVTALVVGLQPLLTATVVGPLLGERVSFRQWSGFVLGLVGVTLVLLRKLSFDISDISGLLWCGAALLGITAGTLYQKKFSSFMDLRSGTVIQYVAAGLAMSVLAPLTETMKITWSWEFIFALLWLSVVLSVGAITLLFVLIRRGKASEVASLFYLVPPCTALIAYFVFGETLGPIALLGMAIAVVGVALVNR